MDNYKEKIYYRQEDWPGLELGSSAWPVGDGLNMTLNEFDDSPCTP